MVLFSFYSCSTPPPFEPIITYQPSQNTIAKLPTPFPPLSKEELQNLWGKELYLGMRFAEEGDGYRAITAFKSALFLLPKREGSRKQQVEFYIVLSYYLAAKYQDAYESYENSSLLELKEEFPAKKELWLALYDSYTQTSQWDKAEAMKQRLEKTDQEKLLLFEAFKEGDVFLEDFAAQRKSPEKAGALQALLPGAGYWYVGLKKTAITSFVINTLFIAATAELAHRGYWAPALITLSLETGWYFGGINGATLAANEYNERLYEPLAKEIMVKERLFPVLRFEFAF